MRIYVKQPGHMAIRLAFPTRLLLNQLTAKTVLKIVQKNAGETFASLSGHDARRFVKAVYRSRRMLKGMPLVLVESAQGETVRIFP